MVIGGRAASYAFSPPVIESSCLLQILLRVESTTLFLNRTDGAFHPWN